MLAFKHNELRGGFRETEESLTDSEGSRASPSAILRR